MTKIFNINKIIWLLRSPSFAEARQLCYNGRIKLSGVIMNEITVRALAVAATYSCILLGVSFLAGCSAPVKYLFHCTVTQPENCN